MIGKGRAVASAAKNRRNQGVWLVNHVVNAWSEQSCFTAQRSFRSHAWLRSVAAFRVAAAEASPEEPTATGRWWSWKTYSSAASSWSRWMEPPLHLARRARHRAAPCRERSLEDTSTCRLVHREMAPSEIAPRPAKRAKNGHSTRRVVRHGGCRYGRCELNGCNEPEEEE